MTLVCTGIGIGVSRSIAMGPAHLLQRGMLEISPQFIDPDETSNEVDRFRKAVSDTRLQLKSVKEKIPENTRSDILAFIDAHLLMLDDSALIEAPIEHIRKSHCTAEWALQLQRDALVEVFEAMEDPYLRTRKDDVDHVVSQLQKNLLKLEDEQNDDLAGKVILARDLTPADTIVLRHQRVAGFITEYGGPLSHTAILARSLGIPAVVGVRHATRILTPGEHLVVDGEQGVVLADADETTILYYQDRIDTDRSHRHALRQLIGQPTVTMDGQPILLLANIELPEDIETTRSLRADGVGLYRTEFLYMNRKETPDEEAHYQTYREVIEGLNGIPITIRTLDLGADKHLDDCAKISTSSCNPALGLRAIRLCLKEPELFRPQLRAILRAAQHGPVRIMIPMLSTLGEIRKLRKLLEETQLALTEEGVPFNGAIPVGGMIEVPAAALSADAFARELDFLSIGTNDLIQYTLAIDRIDDEVTYLFDPLHPAVLKLIKMVIQAGRQAGIPVSMCGEMAGDPQYIPLLLGMGLREFSMQPGSLLEAKRLLRTLDADRLYTQVNHLMHILDEPQAVELIKEICNAGS